MPSRRGALAMSSPMPARKSSLGAQCDSDACCQVIGSTVRSRCSGCTSSNRLGLTGFLARTSRGVMVMWTLRPLCTFHVRSPLMV
eukprot:10791709-Heterocapsa_arctica.AAC.1